MIHYGPHFIVCKLWDAAAHEYSSTRNHPSPSPGLQSLWRAEPTFKHEKIQYEEIIFTDLTPMGRISGKKLH